MTKFNITFLTIVFFSLLGNSAAAQDQTDPALMIIPPPPTLSSGPSDEPIERSVVVKPKPLPKPSPKIVDNSEDSIEPAVVAAEPKPKTPSKKASTPPVTINVYIPPVMNWGNMPMSSANTFYK